jgi:hypothetical protein|tara:strand:- start:203 stop:442 length:240 start_codon:yes stop_codon:yes gene_type:complete
MFLTFAFTLSIGCAKEKLSIKNDSIVESLKRVPEKKENVKPSYMEKNFDIHIFTNEGTENKTVPCYFWTVKNFENKKSK